MFKTRSTGQTLRLAKGKQRKKKSQIKYPEERRSYLQLHVKNQNFDSEKKMFKYFINL